ncbi:FHA domain-containing protein [Persicimonas caeni]|nr:FHA domain-containing protein [Persicimonas caeni]
MPSFWLEYDNNGDIQEFSFDSDSVSVGRDKGSDFVLDHPTVSRQHAVIVFKNGSYYLVVLSRGGLTAIDGQQLQGEQMLYDGNMLHLGQLQFRFRSNHAPQKPANHAQQQAPQAAGFGAQGGGNQNQFGGGNQNQFGGGNQNQNQFGGGGNQNQNQFGGGGFGQQSQSGFGGQNGQGGGQGGQGQYANGFGFGDSPAGGTDANMGGAQPQPNDAQADGGSESGIISWDEIASSSEAMEEADRPKEATVYDRMQQGKKKNEQTNPLLVVVAGAAIVGLLWFTFFNDPGGGGGKQKDKVPVEEQPPVVIEVSCMGESACLQKAKDAYSVGIEKLEKKDAAISNRFEGYKKLLETEKYLEKAGKTELPKEMAKLEPAKASIRKELTDIWRQRRLQYHKAKKRSRHREMAQALDTVKAYFPDPTARENRWAAGEELYMKKKGIYPKHVYPQH